MILLVGLALAGVCDTADGMAEGPARAGLRDGDLGEARRLCPRSEVGLGGGGALLADTANLYGHIVAGATVHGSVALSDRVELFGAVEAVRYDSVIGALSSAALTPGFTTLGAGWRFLDGERFALGLNGAAMLPTAVGLYQHAAPAGVDLGVAWQWAAAERFAVHGQVSALETWAFSAGAAYPRTGANVDAGVAWRPGKAFAGALDVVAGVGNGTALESLAVAPAFRFAAGDRVGLALEAAVPLAGRYPPQATVDLGVTVRLGKAGG